MLWSASCHRGEVGQYLCKSNVCSSECNSSRKCFASQRLTAVYACSSGAPSVCRKPAIRSRSTCMVSSAAARLLGKRRIPRYWRSSRESAPCSDRTRSRPDRAHLQRTVAGLFDSPRPTGSTLTGSGSLPPRRRPRRPAVATAASARYGFAVASTVCAHRQDIDFK